MDQFNVINNKNNKNLNNNNNNAYNHKINNVSNDADLLTYSMDSYKLLIIIVILGYYAVKLLDKTAHPNSMYQEDCLRYKNVQYDFMGLLVFATFIYVFNSHLVDMSLTNSVIFALFYIVGLSFGFFYSQGKISLKNNGDSTLVNSMSSLFYFMVLIVIIVSLIASFNSPARMAIYVCYIVAFVGVAYYLNTFNKKYRSLDQRDTMYVFTDKFVLNVPMVAFLVNLLFLRGTEATSMINIILKTFSGLFLGIFVSCIAIFGVSSLIPQQNTLKCKDKDKNCEMKTIKDDSFFEIYKSSKLANATLIILLIVLLGMAGLVGKAFFS